MHDWHNLNTWFQRINLASGWQPLTELLLGLGMLYVLAKILSILAHAVAAMIHGWPK